MPHYSTIVLYWKGDAPVNFFSNFSFNFRGSELKYKKASLSNCSLNIRLTWKKKFKLSY